MHKKFTPASFYKICETTNIYGRHLNLAVTVKYSWFFYQEAAL